MKKPELIISAGSSAEVKALLLAGADAVEVGETGFGLRLSGSVTLSDLAELVPWVHDQGKKIYVSVNAIIENDQIPALFDYMKQLGTLQVDGILFGDPAVLMAAKEVAPHLKLHWNAEMTSTNYVTANYWGTKGASRVVLARELNMDEVLEFKQHCDLEVQVQVHGMTNIYHSKRRLVDSYLEHRGVPFTEEDSAADRGLYLIEQERPDERYPIYQDSSGTQIMSSDDMCMLEHLNELIDGGLDCFKIEGMMKPLEYNETVVRCYRETIDAYTANPEGYEFRQELLEKIQQLQDPERELSYGFFFKDQVY